MIHKETVTRKPCEDISTWDSDMRQKLTDLLDIKGGEFNIAKSMEEIKFKFKNSNIN